MVRTLTLLLVVLSPAGVWADAAKPTFDDDVAPVLRQHCAGCHNNDKQRGGLNLATYAAIQQGGSSGDVVTAGYPDKSRLYTLTAHIEEPKMPPNGNKIPDADLAILRNWVEQGLRENSGSKGAAIKKPTMDLGLKTVARGRPEGPPPMPGKLPLQPVSHSRRPNAVLALAVSPWAPLVAVGGVQQIVLFNTDTGDLLGVLPFEHGQINSLKFSRSGQLLIAAGGRGGASGKAVVYALDTGAKVAEVGDAETDAILAADLSPDQTLLAVGGPSRLVRIYTLSTGEVLHSIKKHTDWVTAVEFSPDGVLLATGDRAGGLQVWEAVTAREFHTLRGHTAGVSSVSYRADGNLLASASLDGTVRLWEMENGNQVKQWAAHGGGVEAVRFAPDGRVASTGRDRVTKLWNADGGLQREFPPLPDLGLQVAVSHDNTQMLAGDWSGQVQIWTTEHGQLTATVDSNPPSAEEQLKRLEAAVVAAEAAARETQAAHEAAQADLKQKSEAEAEAQSATKMLADRLAAEQQIVTEQSAAVATISGQIATDKPAVDQLAAAVGPAFARQGALKITAEAFAVAARQIAEAAAQAPDNAALAAEAKTAAELAQKHAADRDTAAAAHQAVVTAHQDAAQKLAGLNDMLAASQAKLAAAQKQVSELPGELKKAEDTMAALKPAAEAATKAAQAAHDAADRANQTLTSSRAKLERRLTAQK